MVNASERTGDSQGSQDPRETITISEAAMARVKAAVQDATPLGPDAMREELMVYHRLLHNQAKLL